AVGANRVEDGAIVVRLALVESALLRLEPRPLDREAMRVVAELAREAEVLAKATVLIAGDVGVRAVAMWPPSCSQADQWFCRHPPSTWCAEVAAPKRKPLGNTRSDAMRDLSPSAGRAVKRHDRPWPPARRHRIHSTRIGRQPAAPAHGPPLAHAEIFSGPAHG